MSDASLTDQTGSRFEQYHLRLRSRARGFHLVTDEIVTQLADLNQFSCGLAHVFIHHTSAGLTLNENADPTVRQDMANWFDHTVSERTPYFVHTYEGADDMPAHIKSVLCGPELTIPISDGRLRLGTWQGIYLCEFRNQGGSREVTVTLKRQVMSPPE